jgi:hypothetical protein
MFIHSWHVLTVLCQQFLYLFVLVYLGLCPFLIMEVILILNDTHLLVFQEGVSQPVLRAPLVRYAKRFLREKPKKN